jgi:hypothetical protein
MAYACVSASSAASNVIVAAVAGKSIAVMGLQLIAAGDVTVTIEDSDGTNLIGPMAISANGGFVMPPAHDWSAIPYTVTAPGKGLNMLLSAGVQVGGAVQYALL